LVVGLKTVKSGCIIEELVKFIELLSQSQEIIAKYPTLS